MPDYRERHVTNLFNRFKILAKAYSNIHRPNKESDIFIFTTPRSGSTLLMQLIQTQDGFKICDEPLNVRKPLIRAAIGIKGWDDLLPNPDREDKLRSYFAGIRNNEIAFLNQNPFAKEHRFLTNRLVFKVLHGGEDMITWFRETFNANIVYLIRHPIAVTLSREVYPRLRLFVKNEQYRSSFTAKQIALSESIINKGSHFEQGIVSWCLENYHPLNNPDRKNWVVISYEELVINPEPCINHLAKCLNLSNPRAMLEKINVPSRTVYKSDRKTQDFFRQRLNRQDSFWLITKWKNKIGERELETAFEILTAFNIDAYSLGLGQDFPSPKYLISNCDNLKVQP